MPKTNQIARYCSENGISEPQVRQMLMRGYSWEDIQLMFGTGHEGAARRAVGEAVEAAILRHVARTGRLPCGEEVRIDPEKMERETRSMFQHETGTKGDFYLKPDAQAHDDHWGVAS